MQNYKPYQKPTQEGETFTMTLTSTNGTSETMLLQFAEADSKKDHWYVHFGKINYWPSPNFKIVVHGGSITYQYNKYSEEFRTKVRTDIYSEPSFDITTAQGLAHIKDICDSYWEELSESILNK